MKKKLIGVGLCFSVFCMTNQPTMANTINTDSKVTVSYMTQEQAQKNLENVQKVEDIQKEPLMAIETDINGTTKEVEPVGKLLDLRAPPKDSFRYVPSNYKQSNGSLNPRYKFVGSFSLKNNSSTSINVKYSQQESVTTKMTASTSIEGNTTFKNTFIGEVGAKISAGASVSRTIYKGTTISVSGKVAPNKSINMNAYQKCGKSSGKVIWNKYSSGGSWIGTYSETASGTAPVNGTQIDVTN